MSALAEQHERWSGARERMGLPGTVARVRMDIIRQPRQEEPPRRRAYAAKPPHSAPKQMVVLPPTPTEVWPEQPPAVFYDEAASEPFRSWRSIMIDVSHKHSVTVQEMIGVRHFRRVVLAREEAAYQMSVHLNMSLTAIGRRLGKDHTSVLMMLRRYVARSSVAAAELRMVEIQRRKDRAALKERAADMYMRGKSYNEIMEALPLSKQSVRSAILALKRRSATGVNEQLRREANAGVSEHGDTA